MRTRKQSVIWLLLLSACLAMAISPTSLLAAPFAKSFQFTQPDNQRITLWGEGDDFYAVFETTTGYTVIFDPEKKGYFYATLSADGKSLVSTGVFAHEPPPPALNKHLRIHRDAAAAIATKNRKKWDEATGLSRRWSRLKSKNLGTPSPEKAGATPAPPPTKTTGNMVGLTLLIDFPDDPATMSKTEIEAFLNGKSYTGFGNNGSVWKYFSDVSNGKLSYTNVATIYIRMNQPKSYYNNTDTYFNCGDQGRLLIEDALAIMRGRSDYNDTILPTFSSLTTDEWGTVLGFNVFFAGGNSGVWARGLWPHAFSLAAPVDLGNGKKVFRYQMSNIGDSLELGTFCHENGHMLCSFPDLYDYGYDSVGGAGVFSLMGSGAFGTNPAQVDAYLKTAAGWATVVDVDGSSALTGTLFAAPAFGFNTFYRFRRPGVSTEYFLFENRQNTARDADLPAGGIAAWHVDELGDRDNQSTTPNPGHYNYELTLVQADNLWHFENYANAGDASDLYFLGNSSAGYLNRLDDSSAPSANWWDGSASGLSANSFSVPGMSMTLNFAKSSYTICGTVRAGGATGPVIAGATVSIGGKTATTSSTGIFCITDLPVGTYTLTISKSGYTTLVRSGYPVTSNLTGLEFYLVAQPTYSLSGTVRQGSATGAVLAGATVSIAGKSAVTASTGYFKITGIPAGSYQLIISKSGFITKSIGYAVNGDVSGQVFYLTPVYSLSGTVRQGSATGPVLPGATVSIAGKSAITSSTGYFSIPGIPAGTYTVTISRANYITKTIVGYVVNSNKSGLVFYLSLAPTYSLSGTVRQGSATGAVLPGATVSIAGKTAITTSTGYFSIGGIRSGTYTLTIAKAGYITKTITGYVVNSNKSGLVFYLSVAPTYYISGTVRKGSTSGAVLPGATVSIAGKTTTTSSTGYFSIAGIPAGTYTLTISKAGYTTRTVTGYVVNGNKSGLVFYLLSSYAMTDRQQRGSGTRRRVTLSS